MEENSKTFLTPILKPLKILKFVGGLPLDITVNADGATITFSCVQVSISSTLYEHLFCTKVF